MLILTRRVGETLLIEFPDGQTIEVMIVDIQGSQAKVGITAPPEIDIVREELLEGHEPYFHDAVMHS